VEAPENVQTYCAALTRGLIAEARALGYTVEDEAWRGAHLFGIRLPAGVDLARLQRLLKERNVSVSVRGDALRVAPNVYNDARDVDALAGVLRAAVG
jgi:selenocysteine lyase/cysteine desulfurase